MDQPYDMCCLASPIVYDTPCRDGVSTWDQSIIESFTIRGVPQRRRRMSSSNWLVNVLSGVRILAQCWKFHISARLDNAADILTRVYRATLNTHRGASAGDLSSYTRPTMRRKVRVIAA